MKPASQLPPATPLRPGAIPAPIGTSRPAVPPAAPGSQQQERVGPPRPQTSFETPSTTRSVISPSATGLPPTGAPTMMPVYDMTTGKLLGMFPLAPGVDPATMYQPIPGGGMRAPSSTPASSMAPASTPGRPNIVPRGLPYYDAGGGMVMPNTPSSSAAAAATNYHIPSSSSSSTPAAAGVAGANAASLAAASVSAALANMFSQHGPGKTTITATGGASPRLPKVANDSFSQPKDMYTAPTPTLMLQGSDIKIPSGPSVVHSQSLIPVHVRSSASTHGVGSSSTAILEGKDAGSHGNEQKMRSRGEGDDGEEGEEQYMYSLAATGEQLAELNEARVLAETKVKELEKQLKKLTAKAGVLEADLDAAYSALDGRDSELKRLRQLERAANKRPQVIAALSGNLSASLLLSAAATASSSSNNNILPFSAVTDRSYVFELTRLLPFLQSFPESILWEVLHHAGTFRILGENSAATCPVAKESIMLIVEGTLVYTGNDSKNTAPPMTSSGSSNNNSNSSNSNSTSSGSTTSSSSSSLIIGPGDYLGEQTLLNRTPKPWRDPAQWKARPSSSVTVIALPAALLRRFLLSESAFLDSWSESSVATMLSHTYSPLRPPPRMTLHADAAFSSLVAHTGLHRSLLHVAAGSHIAEALASERAAAARRAGKIASGMGGLSLTANDEDEDDLEGEKDEDDVLAASGGKEGAVARAIAQVPAHLAQNAPLLLQLLSAHGCGIPLERSLEVLVRATSKFFGASGAALYEIDDLARIQQQHIAAQHGRATNATTGTSASAGASAASSAGGAPSASVFLVPRIVPSGGAAYLNRALPIAGTPGVCANTGKVVNIKSTYEDTTYNAAVEPVASTLKPSSLLCVPVYVTIPRVGGGSSSSGGLEGQSSSSSDRRLCAVLQLIDKKHNTAAFFPPAQLRDDELPMFAESAASLAGGGNNRSNSSSSSTSRSGGSGGGGASKSTTTAERATPDYPGAICVGADNLPRYSFTSRDVELAQVVAQRIGDLLTSALQQAIYAVTNMGTSMSSSSKKSSSSTTAVPALNASLATAPALRDDSAAIPGIGGRKKNQHGDEEVDDDEEEEEEGDNGAAANQYQLENAENDVAGDGAMITAKKKSTTTSSSAFHKLGRNPASNTRTVAVHAVTDLLQWRVRTLHTFAPLTSLASPLSVSAEEAVEGYAVGPRYPPPPTALLNGAGEDEEGGGSGGGGGGGPYGSPGSASTGGGYFDAPDAELAGGLDYNNNNSSSNNNGGGGMGTGGVNTGGFGGPGFGANTTPLVASAIPTSVYIYVRACVVVGRLPITPDAASPSARAVNGPAAGRIGNGMTAGSGPSSSSSSSGAAMMDGASGSVGSNIPPGYAGAAAEGCTANWNIGATTTATTGNILSTTAVLPPSNTTRQQQKNHQHSKNNATTNDSSSSSSPAANALYMNPNSGFGMGGTLATDIPDSKGWMDLEVRVCDLPRDSRIVFAVHEEDGEGGGSNGGSGGGGAGRPLFWASCPLFNSVSSTLRTGRTCLPLHAGAWPGAVSGSMDDEASGRCGIIEVDMGSVGIPPGAWVVDVELARGGRWWKGLVAATGMQLEASTSSISMNDGGDGSYSTATNTAALFTSPAAALISPSKPGGKYDLSGGGSSSSDPLVGGGHGFSEPTELILDPSPESIAIAAAAVLTSNSNNYNGSNARTPSTGFGKTATKMNEATRRANEAAAAAALTASLREMGGMNNNSRMDGVDARLSAPSLPALQSGRPIIPLPFPSTTTASSSSSSFKFGSYSNTNTLEAFTSSRPVSVGVEMLTPREVSLLRSLKEGKPAGDVWFPFKPSPNLRQVLWAYRKPLLQAAGPSIVPLLLKAGPFLYSVPQAHQGIEQLPHHSQSHHHHQGSGGGSNNNNSTHPQLTAASDPVVALRAAHILVRSATRMPPAAALQLLDATFTDASLRGAAADALLACLWPDAGSISTGTTTSPFSGLPFIPLLALAAVTEPSIDSPLTRSLLCAAVESPLSVGRQLSWAWRSLLGGTGFRSRVVRLLKGLLDSSDEYATAESALQSFALTQVATACRRGTLPSTKGTRTAALRAQVGGLILPHTIRFPFRPHDPIIPSIYYRVVSNGSLGTSLQKLLDDALGNTTTTTTSGGTASSATNTKGNGGSPNNNSSPNGGRQEPIHAATQGMYKDGTAAGSNPRGRPGVTAALAAGVDRSSSPHPYEDDDDDDEEDDDDDDEMDNKRNKKKGLSKGDNDDDDDEEDESGSTSSDKHRGIALIQDIEDAMAMSLVLLGVYSDAPAFGLTPEIAASPLSTLQTLTNAAREATILAGRQAGTSFGSGADAEVDPRIPMAGAALRAIVKNANIDIVSGAITPSLPFPAAVASAVAAAKAVEVSTAPVEADADMILARYMAAITEGASSRPPPPRPRGVILPIPAGTALPSAGLCVGAVIPDACRVLYSNSRRRYSRSLLVFRAAPEMDERRPGTVTNTTNVPAVPVPLPIGSASYPGIQRLRSHVPRPIRFRENAIHILGISGDDAGIASEALHASMLNATSKIWREAGMTVGDFAAPYVYGVHWSTSRDPIMSSAITVASGTGMAPSVGNAGISPVGGFGTSLNASAGESVGGRLFGILMSPPHARTIAEILCVGEDETSAASGVNNANGGGYGQQHHHHNDYHADAGTIIDDADIVGATRGGVEGGGRGGYGSNGIQRWLMSNLFNRFAGKTNASHADDGGDNNNYNDDYDDEHNNNKNKGNASRKQAGGDANKKSSSSLSRNKHQKRSSSRNSNSRRSNSRRGSSRSRRQRRSDATDKKADSYYSDEDSEDCEDEDYNEKEEQPDEEEEEEEDEQEKGGSGQYSAIVRTFMHSLAAAIVGSYTLALGERRPADIFLTPAGHVMMAGIGYTEGVPDRALHTTATLSEESSSSGSSSSSSGSSASTKDRARFASRMLVSELLAVLGAQIVTASSSNTSSSSFSNVPHLSPLAGQLLTLCGDAFMALRKKAQDVISLAGTHMPLSLPGCSSPYDVACLRARLLLHCSDTEAHTRFQTRLLVFLHLESSPSNTSSAAFLASSTTILQQQQQQQAPLNRNTGSSVNTTPFGSGAPTPSFSYANSNNNGAVPATGNYSYYSSATTTPTPYYYQQQQQQQYGGATSTTPSMMNYAPSGNNNNDNNQQSSNFGVGGAGGGGVGYFYPRQFPPL